MSKELTVEEQKKLVRGRTKIGMIQAGEHAVSSVIHEMFMSATGEKEQYEIFEDIMDIYDVCQLAELNSSVVDSAVFLCASRYLARYGNKDCGFSRMMLSHGIQLLV